MILVDWKLGSCVSSFVFATPEPIQTQAKPQVTFHTSVKEKKPMASKPMASKPMPSKKELEKGMWCTKCESCKFTAQYTKDLKPCGSCHKLCHFNDDMGNCYLWDCVGCAKAVCKECNKAAGGNRLNPYCSKACAKSADCWKFEVFFSSIVKNPNAINALPFRSFKEEKRL